MSDIDKTTWVLEPDNPTYSAIHRRIAVGMYLCGINRIYHLVAS